MRRGSAARLRGLGLLDPYPDRYDPARLALAASPLAAGRVTPLTGTEQAALAAVAVGPLLGSGAVRRRSLAGTWCWVCSWPS